MILCSIYGGILLPLIFFYTLWLLYGNETVPWFDAVMRMERKTNRHRKMACLVQCFCGANNKLAKRDI